MNSLAERIERLSIPGPNTGCWLWLGAPTTAGYGTIGIGRRKTTAHRASYEAHVGPIPDGTVIRHRCHTKSCVNPAHLSIGTHSENISDSVRSFPDKYRNVSKLDLRDRIEQRSVPEPNSGCWLWTGALAPLGYGEILVDGLKTLAHRAAYVAFFGPIPKGALVLHKCDTRPCVNPQHLELGTHREKCRARTARASQSSGRHEHLDLVDRIDRLSIPEPNTGCSFWLGTIVNRTGYGEIVVDGRKISAHRASWIANRGVVPDGLVVMHRCDNRLCVNPDHLSLGTRRDNMVDMSKKGRGKFNKLSTEQRREMSKRAQQTIGPEGRLAATAAYVAAMTPEKRSAAMRKRVVTLGPEKMREIMRKARDAVRTPEQRGVTLEQLSDDLVPFVRHWIRRGHSVESIAVAFNVTSSEIERVAA